MTRASRPGLMVALALLLAGLLPAGLGAQNRDDVARLLARADSAFARRDSAAARAGYEAVLERDPEQSRAVYQLGRLQPAGSADALRLFRRYTELERDDAWGFLALGEAYEDAGEAVAAREAFAAAVALEPSSKEMREALARVSGVKQAPAPARGIRFEPVARYTTDSDGNHGTRTGLNAGLQVTETVTLGAQGSRLHIEDGFAHGTGWEGLLSAEWKRGRTLLVDLRGGALRVDGSAGAGTEPVVEPVVHARLRWRPARGPLLDLRGRREPLGATPHLLATPVVVSEVRGTLELPVASVLRARGMTRYSSLRAPGETNERVTWSAGPALRLGATTEVNASYARTTYARPSTAGYFAPREVEAVDAGVYLEHYGWWPLTLVLDAGGGVERVTRHETRGPRLEQEAPGWRRALRLWSQASWAVAERGELRLEVEASDTQTGDVATSGPGSWRWASVSLSAVWRP